MIIKDTMTFERFRHAYKMNTLIEILGAQFRILELRAELTGNRLAMTVQLVEVLPVNIPITTP